MNTNISINLWFDSEAEEAVKFYTSIFKDSSVGRIIYFSEEGFEFHGKAAGTVMTIEFTLNGINFVALNGGPIFKFNEAISLIINCDTQDEIDYYWQALGLGGDPSAQQCGWLKDKFGVSWQIIPKVLSELINGDDYSKSQRVMTVLLKMKKLVISELIDAYNSIN